MGDEEVWDEVARRGGEGGRRERGDKFGKGREVKKYNVRTTSARLSKEGGGRQGREEEMPTPPCPTPSYIMHVSDIDVSN